MDYECGICEQEYLREDLQRTCESVKLREPFIPFGSVFKDRRDRLNLLVTSKASKELHLSVYWFVQAHFKGYEDNPIYAPLEVLEKDLRICTFYDRITLTDKEFEMFVSSSGALQERLTALLKIIREEPIVTDSPRP